MLSLNTSNCSNSFWPFNYDPRTNEMSKAYTSDKKGDISQGEVSPHPNEDDEGDHEVDGEPPPESVPAESHPPRPEGEGDKEGRCQKTRQEEWARRGKIHGRPL